MRKTIYLVIIVTFLIAAMIYLVPLVPRDSEDSAQAQSRLIGGTPATASDVQGYVVVEADTTGGRLQCGGMLIDPEWVLTIDRCVDGYKTTAGKPDIRVGIGCLSNVPRCLDDNNRGMLFHNRLRLRVNTIKVVKNATASVVLLKIPRTVLGSGVAVFSVATEADIAALKSSPYMLSLGNISASSSAKTLMKGNIKFATDGVCQTAFGGKYKASLMNCVDGKADKKVFCFDVGSPILGVIGQQPLAYGIMLAETSVGVAPANRCKPSMSRMAYVDLTLPVTRNWIRETVRTQTKRPLVTRLDGLYGDATIAPNDTTRTIDISPVFPTGIRLGSVTATSLSVSENGVVALGSGVAIPMNGFDLTRWRGAPLFAPFAADANTANPQLRAPIGDLFVQGKNAIWSSVDPQKRSVTITWEAIQPAWSTAALSNTQNTFQLILQNMNNGDVKVVFTYGMMSWGFGTKNCIGTCDYSTARRAQIGVSAGNGTVSIHTASAKPNQLDLLTAQGSTYLVIRAGKAGAWGATPVPVATWTASATPTPNASSSATSTSTITSTFSPTRTVTVSMTSTATPTSTPLAHGLTDGLLAWYPLNGIRTTGSTLPVQVNTIMGATQYFDGVNDYHQTTLDLANTSFTVAFWATFLNEDDAIGMTAVSAGSHANNYQSLGLSFHRNTIGCGFYADDLVYTNPNTFDRGQWHHYACTYDIPSSSRNIMIDGVIVASDRPHQPLNTTNVFTIGKPPWNYNYFKGTIRDVMVYNRALSASEINRIKDITPNSVMLSEPHPASACRWVDKGGMVHEYEINQDLLTWDQAKAAAEARTRGGQPGYLATITSAAENECLAQFVDTQSGWTNGATGYGPWLGAKRNTAGGTFIWQGGLEKGIKIKSAVTGLSLGYENWYSSEPNNTGGREDSLALWHSTNKTWNDGPSSDILKSIIEYTYPESHAISGVAYTDTNSNNQPDAGDFRAANQTITLTADLAQPIDIVGGGNQMCARLDDGRAVCWGRRGDSWRWDQQSAVPIEVDGWRDVTAISNGVYTSCALLGNGTVSCLGKNSHGAVGDGTTADRWTPVMVRELSNVIGLNSGGGYHHCAVLASGTVKCWGDNAHAQIGDGTYDARRITPALVTGLSGVVQVSVGERHTCARKGDGSVWCWGSNDTGQLADVSVADSATPRQITGLSGIKDVKSGAQHVCVIRSDNQVACWGYPTGITGNRSGLQVTSPTLIENTTDTVSLSAGNEQSCVAKSDGTVWCWGHVFHGEAGRVATGATTTRRSSAVQLTSLSNITQVAQSKESACGRRTNGDMLCWGEANRGQLGDGTYQPRGIANYVRVTWQTNPYAARVAFWQEAGWGSCAILTDRRVACWGSKHPWWTSTPETTLEPGIINGLTDIVDLNTDTGNSCALKRNGTVWCWGTRMVASQFVNGVLTTDIPQMHLQRDVIGLSHGGAIRCFTASTGLVSCYKNDTPACCDIGAYRLPSGSTMNNDVGSVDHAYLSSCYLKQSSGDILCWGDNTFIHSWGMG